MAIFSVNNSNDRFTLTLTVTETSYSVTDNTSTLSWSLDLKANTSYNFSLYSIGLSVVLNGTTVKSQTRAQRVQYSVDDYGTVNLASGSGFVVKHNDDGSKSIPVVYSIDMESVSYTPGPLSSSGTMPLTTIARYSTLTIPSGGTLGVKQSITVNRPSNLTHTVTWVCGTQKGTLCTNSTATTLDFTPDIELAAQNIADQSVVITFNINTNGVGDKTYPVTYAIPASVVPDLEIDIEEETTNILCFGDYVQGYCKLKITVTPTIAYGSPIASYNITADGKTYTTNPVVTDVITSSDKVVVKAYVTDQRRRSSRVVEREVYVLPYSPPAAKLSAYRCREDGTSDDEGAYIIIKLSADVTNLNYLNTPNFEIKCSGGTSWGTTGSELPYISDPIACDVSQSCAIEAKVSDALSYGEDFANIPIAFTLMEFYNTGKGVAFGKVATQDGFDCAMPAYFTGGIYIDGKPLAQYIADLINK